MEFKFRAVDDRPPPFPSPPSSCFNHSDQPLPMAGQTISPMLYGPSGFPMGDLGQNSGLTRNPSDVQKHIVRELEQERLSEEMILEEIARRRELEAVVRQEIVFLEREMAMRRAAMGAMSFEDGFPAAMHFAPFPYSSRSAAFDPFSMALPPENIAPVFKPSSEPNNDKLIVLAKPELNLSRAKRKALEPPTLDSNEIYPFGLKKKPKEELSCALCQVSATGEKDLNNHLQGKKHKRKEAALRNQKMGKKPSNAPCPKKSGNPPKLKETNGAANSNLEVGKFIKQIGSHNGPDKKKEDAEDVKPKNMLLMQKDQIAGELNKTSRSEIVQKAGRSADHKATKRMKTGKKIKYWCEMCQVGSLSSRVMEQHKKGKKHRGKLLGYETNRSEEATLKNQPSEAVPVKPEDPDVAEQAAVKTTDNVGNTEAVDEKPEDKDVASQANDKITDDMANVQKLKVIDVANQVNEETTNGMENTEAIHEKPEDKDVANQTNEKTTEDMEYAKAIHEKPEDRDVANQASERATVDLTNAKAVPENPEGTDVANQENAKSRDDMANTEAVHETPVDVGVANQANEKTTNDMTNTEVVLGKTEDTDVVNHANGNAADDMANETQLSQVLLQKLQRLQRLCSVDEQS